MLAGIWPLAADWVLPTWELTRTAGFLAYLTLWLAVVAGLLLSSRVLAPRAAPALTVIHDWSGTWAVYTTLFHAAILRYDTYMPFDWTDLFLPLAAEFQPVLVALGIYALYGVVGIVITSYLREQVRQPLWRWVHWLSGPAYLLALIHGVALGTDTQEPWAQALYAVTAGVLVLMLLIRLMAGRGATRGRAPVRGDVGANPGGGR